MVYELLAYNTESFSDILYREYTTSQKKVDRFKRIPKIQFTDSGHGIVFWAFKHKGRREKTIHTLYEYVAKHLKSGEPQ